MIRENFDIDPFFIDGYIIVRNVIPLELIVSLGDFLVASIDDSLKPALNFLEVFDEKQLFSKVNSFLRNDPSWPDRLPKEIKQSLTGHFSLSCRLAPQLRAIPMLESVRKLVTQALSAELCFMHMPPTARFVLPGNSMAAVPPHQDISYNTQMSDFVILWVPFVDIDSQCGGVDVFENLPRDEILPLGIGQDSFWLGGVNLPNAVTKRHCEMNRGDVLLMNKYTVHSSHPNNSRLTRLSCDYRFTGSPLSEKHLLNLETGELISPNLGA